MGWISKYVAVWQGRIALGLAFFGAILVGLWPDHARNIDPAKLVACILTGSAWMVAELERESGELGCPCTLKLWEAQGPRTVTLWNVTFPASRQGPVPQ
ncbi:hypothetical protein ACN28S_63080 [Cystobacter fuscus]